MKYKIGDVVIYKEEYRQFGTTSTRYTINNIVALPDLSKLYGEKMYYEVIYPNYPNDVFVSMPHPRVAAESFERCTELDKSYIRETKINNICSK